jgi:murein DD-endopeptidase MepM/ murein hydrolase activator NlpD
MLVPGRVGGAKKYNHGPFPLLHGKQSSMMNVDPTPQEISPGEVASEPSQTRRDAFIAGIVLGVLVGALTAYLVVFSQNSSSKNVLPEVSSASWVGEGEDASEDISVKTGNGGENDNSELPIQRYAPTAAELASPVEELESGKAEAQEEENDDSGTGIVKRGTVKSGIPVLKNLTQLGLSMSDAHALILALDGIFDFRRARPGQTFEVRLSTETNKPISFRYDVSRTEIYEVKLQGDVLKGRRRNIPTQKRLKRFGGTISSSLYKALVGLEAHPGLSGKIVEVLSKEVNFYKEQRPGDTFRAIIEEESLNGEFLKYGPILALEYIGVKAGKKRFFRFEPEGQLAFYYNEKGISQPRSVISIPLHYTRISSPFGKRFHPILKRKILHNGVDFAAAYGTPVWACQKGTVTFAAKKGANGNLVVIKHDADLSSAYAHLQRFAAGIRKGVEVRERQVIAYVGSTGRSTGPHLHFGLKKSGRFIDPLKYKVQPGRPVAAKYRGALKSVIRERAAQIDKTPIRPPAVPLQDMPELSNEVLGVEEL